MTTPRQMKPRIALLSVPVLVASILAAGAQTGASTGGDLQQKVAAVKLSVAENQQRLHQYQWMETSQLTLKGNVKPSKLSLCQYGPDGQVVKTPLGAPPDPPSGGRMKQRVIAKKTAEMQDYMGQVKTLLSLYVPPDSGRMQQALQSGKASLSADPSAGSAQIVFKDYAQPGDQMTLSFNTLTKKVSSVNVNTYMDSPQDVVTLAIQFASLPNSINYVQQTVLEATAKQLQVTTTSSNYQVITPQ